MIRFLRAISCVVSALSLWTGVAQEIGDDFELTGSVTGGGGISADGEFRVVGGIPNTAPGESSGGDFAVRGGFLELFTMPGPEGDVTLFVALEPGGIRISWPGATGVALEATTLLGPGAVWQTIQTSLQDTSILLRLDQRAQFFRVRRH